MTKPKNLNEAALIEYLDECCEMLERFSKSLTLVESGAADPNILASIYRDMHTIKGTSQLFGFSQVSRLAHALETCLDPVRKGYTSADPVLIDCLYVGCDIITTLLDGIRKNAKEPEIHEQIEALIPRLIEASESAFTGATAIAQDKIPPTDSNQNSELQHVSNAAAPEDESQVFEEPKERVAVPDQLTKSNESKSEKPVEDAPPVKMSDKASQSTAKPSQEDGQSETIRVHVSLLDNLMNLIGELVLIRNQLLQHAKDNESDSGFIKLSQRLNILTAELQNEVMKTRMQPIGNILGKFTRVVRDMGRELGKKIELNIQGAETELDKTIIEAVKDPLTHIVRNSVDHGIESSADRSAADKAEVGHVNIKAYHESGQVIIEISDDGRGLDPQRIGAKAAEKGLITAEVASKMSERDLQYLIFAPGFSTTSSVSNLSGRGVGMDVVRTNIERIGGIVDLTSTVGRGTNIKLKIPLTLAIVPALIVRAQEQRFAIPQSKLVELVRIDPSDTGGEKLETLQGSPVLRLRGKILPLLNLSEILKKTDEAVGTNPIVEQCINIVILNADAFQFGLIVDEVEDTADIVVKSLSAVLKELSHFSGATIMGDGTVALTIDVMGISAAARVDPDAEIHLNASSDVFSSVKKKHTTDDAEFLLVGVGAPGSYAIPLTVVSRLEEFDADSFELSGEQQVVRYRDSLLPIFSLPNFLNLPFDHAKEKRERTPVVVIRRGDRLFGIEVEEIQDVVSLPSQIDQTVRDRPGILGTMMANERVLVVVDILGMIDAVKSNLNIDAGVSEDKDEGSVVANSSYERRRNFRILIAEDSSFFRNYVKQTLEDAGFKTATACDGVEAWSALDHSEANYFDLLLSDIEMPEMDGYDLARKVSSDQRFKHMPLVAITTRFSNDDIETGRKAGFTRYFEKLNAEKLIIDLDALLFEESEKELKHA